MQIGANGKYLFTEDERLDIVNSFKNGESLVKIAKRYNMSRRPIRKIIEEEGLEVVINNQQYTYNVDYFKVIDTEEKAYWLGFLYADGNISKNLRVLEVGLKYDDIKHLELLGEVLSPNKKPKEKIVKLNGKEYRSCRITFHNKTMIGHLINLGCKPQKSLDCRLPSIEEELYRHFIRGYFDGNGAIWYSQCIRTGFFSGSYKMIEDIQQKLLSLCEGLNKTKILKDTKNECYSIQSSGSQGKMLLDWLYKDSTISLERKYLKYIEVTQQ